MLPVQDCTCWSQRMDWSKALQIKLYIVSPTTNSNIVSKSRLEIILNCAEHCTAGLMEIRPVDPGCVVIRGAATTRFLCIGGGGRLYSSVRIFYTCNMNCLNWTLPWMSLSIKTTGQSNHRQSQNNCIYQDIMSDLLTFTHKLAVLTLTLHNKGIYI